MVLYGSESVVLNLAKWINLPGFFCTWSFLFDPLSIVMLFVVNTVSFLVHYYSFGYMCDDDSKSRFFIYLSLFTFFMLLLVTSTNLLQMFVGWEGVGLCSYLLIGFYYTKESANCASMKAFIVNRIGDVGFLLGMFGIYKLFGTLNLQEIHGISLQGEQLCCLNLSCLFLFIGCMGKSAQIGLHVWLPDAMEGPTPVSALIHAATMVTAGVFLLARCSILFEYAEHVRNLIVIIGVITSFVAATIALTQNDIKKIIAWSTCSQLGYMFIACGISFV